jgi:uncharacterized protein involved in type VI secretion and phage assembly
MTGNGRGFFTLPEVDDEVLLAFESGDPSRPIVLGALWNGKDKPPDAGASSGPLLNDKVVSGTKAVGDGGQDKGKVVHRTFKSRAGHVLLLDDTSGKEQVVISDKNGNYVVLRSAGNLLKIKTAGNIEIESSANITMKAAGNINIEASGQLNLKGARVNIN